MLSLMADKALGFMVDYLYVSVELDLSDITCVKCKVCMGNGDDTVCSDEFISRAFQR